MGAEVNPPATERGMLGASPTHRKARVSRSPKRRTDAARATRAKKAKGSSSETAAEAIRFEPKYPALTATACFGIWIILLSVPMLSGGFLAAPYNDQYSSGYAYRAWAAEWWKALGHVPLWNPEIFGGM